MSAARTGDIPKRDLLLFVEACRNMARAVRTHRDDDISARDAWFDKATQFGNGVRDTGLAEDAMDIWVALRMSCDLQGEGLYGAVMIDAVNLEMATQGFKYGQD